MRAKAAKDEEREVEGFNLSCVTTTVRVAGKSIWDNFIEMNVHGQSMTCVRSPYPILAAVLGPKRPKSFLYRIEPNFATNPNFLYSDLCNLISAT